MARAHACRTTPKSARKGYPHSFRIDLAGDDRGGGSSSGGKFVISAPSAEEMREWMERIGRYSGMKESDVAAWRRQPLRLSSSSGAAPPEPEPLASPPPSPQQQPQPQPRSRRHVGAMRCQFDGKGAFAQVFAELCETSLTLRERRDGPVLRTASLASGKVSAPKSARKVANKPQMPVDDTRRRHLPPCARGHSLAVCCCPLQLFKAQRPPRNPLCVGGLRQCRSVRGGHSARKPLSMIIRSVCVVHPSHSLTYTGPRDCRVCALCVARSGSPSHLAAGSGGPGQRGPQQVRHIG
jgi:hypothetical protein